MNVYSKTALIWSNSKLALGRRRHSTWHRAMLWERGGGVSSTESIKKSSEGCVATYRWGSCQDPGRKWPSCGRGRERQPQSPRQSPHSRRSVCCHWSQRRYRPPSSRYWWRPLWRREGVDNNGAPFSRLAFVTRVSTLQPHGTSNTNHILQVFIDIPIHHITHEQMWIAAYYTRKRNKKINLHEG